MSKAPKNNNDQTVCFRTSIGGQALLEGILMRGPVKQAIVCRTPDGLVEKVEELHFVKDKHPILGWPLIRGVVTFIDSMVKGMQALTYSADLLPIEEQGEPDKLDQWIEAHFPEDKAKDIVIGVAVVLGVLLAVGLFVLLPTLLGKLCLRLFPGMTSFTLSLAEGVFRIVIFLLYLWGVTKMEDVSRMFAYHGAEHKTIFCYEKQLPLTVENVRIQSRFHPRCGTSFLFNVIIISILIFSAVSSLLVNWQSFWLRFLLHLALLPVIVSLTYELNRWVGRHEDLWICRVLAAPGKWMQHLTTNEPDDGMIECAIRSLELVIPETQGSDAW